MTEMTTPRLALPLLQPGQAQKEMFHNESIARLDMLVQASAATAVLDAPPVDPEPGRCWIVGTAPTGEWLGQAGAIAGWTSAGWIFVQPREGMQLWLDAEQGSARHIDGMWRRSEVHGKLFVEGDQVVGPRGIAITEPSGGLTVDGEARVAIVSVLEALRAHGLIGSG